ncbi:hypothetical protein ACJMK2_009473 [Sinanodonta woodiana]|uniref:RING-type domain-containing protein n=1 Tax=Sinanodonta woodiana TaxID=1069815 RepID=A0ABD3VDX4_SINWO
MEDINDIRLGSTIPFEDQELQRWTALERIKAENQKLRIFLLCRICGINRISCVLPCGHLTCWKCADPLVCCPVCDTPTTNKYCIYLHPPYSKEN